MCEHPQGNTDLLGVGGAQTKPPLSFVSLLRYVSIYLFSLFFYKVFFFNFYLFYFWLCWVFVAARGLSSGCGKRGLLFIVVHGLLMQWLLLLQSTGSRRPGFSSCGTWAQ